MGNTQSSVSSIPLSNILNYVSANYMLTSKFQDMQKLAQKDYCDNIVVLTSKIISNNLTNQEIEYLSQRLRGNKEVNYMKKERVAYIPREELMQLDIRNKTQKKRVCIGIAKFYVKVAHIYGAIVTTLRPSNSQEYSDTTKKQNICNNRINALEQNKTRITASGMVNVVSTFCNMNNAGYGNVTLLHNEPGIKELEKLYYDKFNYSSGEFVGMTDSSRKEYEKDVKFFYKAFTGEKCPPHIKTFGQIPLIDYTKHRLCNTRVEASTETNANLDDNIDMSVSQADKIKERLLKKYANHIRDMLKTAETKRNKLLSVIDKLFVFGIHPQTQKKEIMVNPSLTMKELDKISIEARNHIKELYAECEKNFVKGLNIFEAIVQAQILQTSKNQIRILERKRNNIRKSLYDKQTEKKEPQRNISEYRGAPGSPPPFVYRSEQVRFNE